MFWLEFTQNAGIILITRVLSLILKGGCDLFFNSKVNLTNGEFFESFYIYSVQILLNKRVKKLKTLRFEVD